MVTASELLGIGSSGGGSSQIESTVDSGSSLSAGEPVSINAAGEFVPFDGSLPLFGIATTAAAGGATTTITSVAAFAGTVGTFASASDLNGQSIDIDVATMAIDTGNTGLSTGGTLQATRWSNDGTKAFRMDSDDIVREFNLSTAYDLTTGVAGATVSLSSDDSGMAGLDFSADGTKMYTIGTTNDNIYEYTLSSPYAISTASSPATFSVPNETYVGITISEDGKYLLTVTSSTDIVRSYLLSTPNDLSTAALDSQVTLSGANGAASFSPTGDKMYLLRSGDFHEYGIPTNFDLASGITFDDSFNTPTSRCFDISTDGVNILVDAQNYTNTPVVSPLTIDSGTYVYSDNSGNLTNTDTGNFVGFKATPTQLIFIDEPA